MNRTLLGAFATLLLSAVGLFWWQGRASVDPGPIPAAVGTDGSDPLALPTADLNGIRGPELPHATEQTREQKRFDRLDRDRSGRISRTEMLVPRAALFRKLDSDGNNLLTFEEWAVVTADRFRTADANHDLQLDRIEFASTKPKLVAKPDCSCTPTHGKGRAKPRLAPSDQLNPTLDDNGEPVG